MLKLIIIKKRFYSMKIALMMLCILFFTFILGCVPLEKRKRLFVEERNRDIGKAVDNVVVPDPDDIIKIDEEKSKYFYQFKNSGCQWIYIVDNKNKKIISWEFISDPDLCFLTFRW